MNQPQKDIVIFGSYVLGFSIISIFIAVTIGFENGVAIGVVLGIGILLCVGCRQVFMNDDQTPITKLTDSSTNEIKSEDKN